MKYLSQARGATLILGALLCASSARAQGVFDMGMLTNTLTVSQSEAQKQQGTGGMPDLSDFGGAIVKKSKVFAAQKTKPAGVFKTSLSVPSIKPGEAAKGLIRQMRLKMEEQAKVDPAYNKPEFLNAFRDMENQMPQVLTGIETELGKQGFTKRDMGVAAGAVFATLYETANNTKLSDQAERVVIKTMASVADTAWGPKWKTLAPAAKEDLYEKLIISAAFTAVMADATAKNNKPEEEASFRQSAATTFETLVGTTPSQVKIADDGQITGTDQPAAATDAPATDTGPTDAPPTEGATNAPATGAPTPDDLTP